MAEKPSTLPVWATNPGTTVTPSGGQQAAGFAAGTKPPARWVNWILNLIYGWIQYLDAPTGTGSAAGLKGTGGSTDGPGLWGVGGATNGRGVLGQGTGSGTGVRGEGGATGIGVRGVGGATSGNGGNFTSQAGNSNGITATGDGTGSGIIGTGGTASGTGGHTVGGAPNGNGFEGEATGSGTGVWGHSPSGYGVIAESDTTSPAKAALRIVPQDTDPSSPTAGATYLNSGGLMSVYDGSNWLRLPSKVKASTPLEASLASTAAHAFAAKYTIPANMLKAGSSLRVRAHTYMSSTAGGGTLNLQLKIGGVRIAETGATAVGSLSSTVLDYVGVPSSANGIVNSFMFMATVSGTGGDIASGSTLDFTTSQDLEVWYTLSNASDQVTLSMLDVEIAA
jgi:hypothetical protein